MMTFNFLEKYKTPSTEVVDVVHEQYLLYGSALIDDLKDEIVYDEDNENE